MAQGGHVHSLAGRYGTTVRHSPPPSSRGSSTGSPPGSHRGSPSRQPQAQPPAQRPSFGGTPSPPTRTPSLRGPQSAPRGSVTSGRREGWLKKIHQARMSISKNRWLQLRGDGYLRYSETQDSPDRDQRKLPLAGARLELRYLDGRNCLVLSSPHFEGGRTYTFCAEDSDRTPQTTIRAWEGDLLREIAAARRPSPPAAAAGSPPSGRLAQQRTRSASVLRPDSASAFSGLLQSYCRLVPGDMHDRVDTGDMSQLLDHVREIADPSQLALSKLHEYDTAAGTGISIERELEKIWERFDTDRDGQLSRQENMALVQAYLEALKLQWRPLLAETVTKVFRLFSRDLDEATRRSSAFLQDLTRYAEREADAFFSTLHVSSIAQELWERMDLDKDGVVSKHEFMESFLRALDLQDMPTASVSVITDEVIRLVHQHIVKLTGGRPLGVCGLSNIGNTCYMNSALQCLSATTRFRNFFISFSYKQFINPTNRLGTGGRLATAFGALMNDLWSGESQAIRPTDFKRVLGACNEQFQGWAQEDSQELLSYLLDRLHEDLNEVTVREYVELKDRPGAPDLAVAEEYWLNHTKRNRSVVVSLFQGQLRSIVRCKECRYEGKAFDPFMYLSLPVPERGGSCSLADCMNKFTAAEEIAGSGNEWYCPRCKRHVPFRKDISLWRLPYYLIVHLKRFRYNAYGTASSKIDAKVDFPAVLDPSAWMAPGRTLQEAMCEHQSAEVRSPADVQVTPLPQCAVSPRMQHASLPGSAMPQLPSIGPSSSDLPRAASSPCYSSPRSGEKPRLAGQYHLYGVINHYGSISGGHYTAYTTIADRWYCFDDSYVSEVKENICQKARLSGYVLFYKLR
eukprot:TRINITY_DN4299_c0_g1_i1.p1 TRINITY_DN4299_c0_g1~~TRINITY_DN4299_c0_g1_i1.p1  ORF type:complete len:854 (+),score=158.44 TRINITY_DN4299_c0_g1_i1:47-2608(+)